MADKRSFTGTARKRQTSWSVAAGDRVAKAFITIGGVGTIVAVLLVLAYLVSVVLPLFVPPKVTSAERFAGVLGSGSSPSAIGVDEFGLIGWALMPDGRIHAFRTDNGHALEDLPPEVTKLGGMSAASFAVDGQEGTFGFRDGTIRTGRIGFATTFLEPEVVKAPLAGTVVHVAVKPGDLVKRGQALVTIEAKKSKTVVSAEIDGRVAADGLVGEGTAVEEGKLLATIELPDAIRDLKPGESVEWDRGMVTRTPTAQFRRQRLKASVGDPLESGTKGAVRLVDRAASVFCYCSATGKLYIAPAPSEGGLSLSGDESSKLTPVGLDVPAADGGPPKFVLVGGLGDYAYAAWENGRLLRFEIRNPAKPRLVEDLRIVTEPGAKLQSLVMLLGGGTLIAGDSLGQVKAWFPVIPTNAKDSAGNDGRKMVCAHTFPAEGSAVTAIASSSRAREVVVGYASGRVRLLFVTTDNQVLEETTPDARPIQAVQIAPKGDRIVAATAGGVSTWTFNQAHPDATLSALFLPVWYQDEPRPKQVWQTTGSEGSEPKLGLTPLVFGTLKATFYAMLFGAPLALLAALFTSEFLHPNTRARIKPTIELMASLPSVVLGFLAGLVIAPVFSTIVPAALAALATVPCALLLGAYLWQLLPPNLSVRLGTYRFFVMLWLAIPAGLLGAALAGPWLERVLFGGDIKAWLLTPLHGSAVPGWMLLLLPLGAIAVAVFMSRVVNPWMRIHCAAWSRRRCALAELAKFFVGAVLTFLLVAAVGWILDGFKIDPRETIVGKYEELNSLVVGFAMGFAIIPLIYTIADDALASVPAHLRSASLGAGATPWQTAVRIVIPTAMSGLFSAVMIGLGRAVGETMIVLMAAGGTAIMDVNPFNGFQTLSASIATQLPEAAVGSSHQRVLFLSALTLFIITFVINTAAEMIRQRFRRRAYEL
jgi:phosphate transport system permease protein